MKFLLQAKPLALILTLGLLTGCTSTHLVYVYDSSLGIDVSPAASDGTSRLSLGYESETFALVPRFTPDQSGKNAIKPKAEAMSLVSVSNVDATGLSEVTFNHVIMTGRAAKAAATDTEGLAMLRDAVYGPSTTTGTTNP